MSTNRGLNRGRGPSNPRGGITNVRANRFKDMLSDIQDNQPEGGWGSAPATFTESPADTTAPLAPASINMQPEHQAPTPQPEAAAPVNAAGDAAPQLKNEFSGDASLKTEPAIEKPIAQVNNSPSAQIEEQQLSNNQNEQQQYGEALPEAIDFSSEFGSRVRGDRPPRGPRGDNDRGPRRPRNDNNNEESRPDFAASRDSGAPREGSRRIYVPIIRDVTAIRKEDQDAAVLYRDLFDNDEDIDIAGIETPSKIDNWRDEKRIHPSVMANIEKASYVKPRKIQSYSIPLVFDGYDVKGQAETGSGKSGAFLIPIISEIARLRATSEGPKRVLNHPLCMIIEPTRELALQLYDQGRKLADETNVQVVKAYGEYDYKTNAREVIQGCDVVVGTPGRLLAFLQDGLINPDQLKWLVLDEADRLLDQNFQRDIVVITNGHTFPKKEDRQTLLFSATFPKEVTSLVESVLKKEHVSVSNKRQSAPNSKVEQQFESVSGPAKKEKVVEVLKQQLDKLREIDPTANHPRTLIFVERKRDADVLALYLCQYDLPANTINADRTQDLRELALQEFRDGEKPILVATDVCARGLDIKNLQLVVNLDMPRDIESYVHRIGRTGRLEKGSALSFFDAANAQDVRLAKPLAAMLRESCDMEVPDFIDVVAQAEPEQTEVLPQLDIEAAMADFDMDS